MRKFSSEFIHNYKKYSFGYANYCLKEKNDKISDIYNSGYLPYSGSPGIKNVFYMARSARVPLKSFSLTSENRRVARKFDEEFSCKLFPIKDFNIKNKEFISFCAEYFVKRHGPLLMPKERILTILQSGLITHIVAYYKNAQPRAYVFEVSDDLMTHFWFSFYDLSYIHQSLGMWLMLNSARMAKERGIKYFYTGTVYGEKALYKTAFKNVEHWNGDAWVCDIKKLKALSRTDNDRTIHLIDAWKNDMEIY